MKKLTSLFLVLLMITGVVFCMPLSVNAEESVSVFEGFLYIILPDETVEIVGHEDFFTEELNIPSVIDGLEVSSIGDEAFSGFTNTTSVTFPEHLKNIGEYAFRYCYGLTELELPQSVETIEKGAFYSCTDLTEIVLPDSVTHISKKPS